MIKAKRIDHVAIAVADAPGAESTLASLFGLERGTAERVASQHTDVVFLHPSGTGDGSQATGRSSDPSQTGGPSRTNDATALELICPAGNASLERFLDRRGPGLHHVCFEVEDLAGSLAELRSAGIPLVDEAPRPGARGHLVAFIHPRATGGVLFELCQKSAAPVQGDAP